MSTENSATDNVPKAAKAALTASAPPVFEEPQVKAGPGQTVVTSPAGTKYVVEDEAVALLKTQGYRVA
jgi:hypothetical protein